MRAYEPPSVNHIVMFVETVMQVALREAKKEKEQRERKADFLVPSRLAQMHRD